MKLYPYIFCHGENANYLHLQNDTYSYDCTKLSSHPFFELLEKLDQTSFGGQGMGMERWTFYDCGAMPGVIYGYGIKREDLDVELIKKFGFDLNDHPFIPISMFVAIPKLGDSCWFAHNLCSIAGKLGIKGLGIKTKVDALNAMKVKTLYGATQWGSPAAHIHSQISDLKLVSAYTPNHSYPFTLTYRCYETEWKVGQEKRVARKYDRLINVADQKSLIELHSEIEDGLKIQINGRPLLENGDWYYPLSFYK